MNFTDEFDKAVDEALGMPAMEADVPEPAEVEAPEDVAEPSDATEPA